MRTLFSRTGHHPTIPSSPSALIPDLNNAELIRSGQIGRRSIAAINEVDRFLEENYIHLFHRRVQEGSNSTGKCELGGRQEEKNSKKCRKSFSDILILTLAHLPIRTSNWSITSTCTTIAGNSEMLGYMLKGHLLLNMNSMMPKLLVLTSQTLATKYIEYWRDLSSPIMVNMVGGIISTV